VTHRASPFGAANPCTGGQAGAVMTAHPIGCVQCEVVALATLFNPRGLSGPVGAMASPHFQEMTMQVELTAGKFRLGLVVATRGVNELVQQGVINPLSFIRHHSAGDWGDLCEEDRALNDMGLLDGGRLFSSYQVNPDLKLWVITEWDRSCTTLLLPSEY
jgi:hypothetical protein